MSKCRIIYDATSEDIFADYEPGNCHNFTYWFYKTVKDNQCLAYVPGPDNNSRWLRYKVTEVQATYIEQLAIAQYGSCEVIGRPVARMTTRPPDREPVAQAPGEQLALF